ncbi:MAG: PAS domain S-box protein [Longimicrobiales bacterium]
MPNNKTTSTPSVPTGAEQSAPIGDIAPAAPQWITPAAAVVVGVLALAVLVGWQFDVPVLRSASPDQLAMPPLTAFGLLLGAGALWLLEPMAPPSSRRGLGHVLAALVCALGLATLIEHAAAVDLGIDLLLFPTAVLDGTAPPYGRPSPSAAAALALLGGALLLVGVGPRTVWAAQWLALAGVLITALALLGFLYRIPELYGPPGYPPMALHTTLGLLVLAVGILFARHHMALMAAVTGRDVGGLTARRLLPIGVLLPVLLGALVAEVLRAGALRPAHGLLLVGAVLSIAFGALVWRSALVLRRIDRERRRTAVALVQSEERFRSLAENAADAMITINTRDAIVFANPAAERLFGYTATQLMEMRFTELMPERYREAHREGIRRYERSGKPTLPWSGIEFTGLRRDGREVPLEITLGEYVRDDRRYFTGIMRDVTERHRAQAAQRLLVEAGHVLSASLDYTATLRGVTRLAVAELAEWCVVYGRDARGLRLLELAAHDLVREVRLRELERAHPPSGVHPLLEVVETGEPLLLAEVPEDLVAAIAESDEHLALLHEVGYRSLVLVPLVTRSRTIGALALGAGERARNFTDADVRTVQELAASIAFAMDNARLYRAARGARTQAETRTRELERVTESRARLMRGFSHDLKNPLAAADGHAQLMEAGLLGPLAEKQRQSVDAIRRAVRTALELIDKLIELARTEAAQVEVELAPVDASRLARDAIEECRPQAQAKSLTLDIDAPPSLPALGDPSRVSQIMANLLGNAVKYTREGHVTVRVSTVSDAGPRPGAWVRIDVEDTGIGIAEEHQPQLFEEFTRFVTDVPGSGLGLSISRNLAEALGGAITVSSVPEKGACFSLWLQAASASGQAQDTAAAAPEEDDGPARPPPERAAQAQLRRAHEARRGRTSSSEPAKRS